MKLGGWSIKSVGKKPEIIKSKNENKIIKIAELRRVFSFNTELSPKAKKLNITPLEIKRKETREERQEEPVPR